jgi:hypothetical protein
MQPLSGLLDVAYAFSGKESDPSIDLEQKHVLGGITKYVFS